MNNKKLWSTAKPFLISKEVFAKDQISISTENDIMNNEKRLVETFWKVIWSTKSKCQRHE